MDENAAPESSATSTSAVGASTAATAASASKRTLIRATPTQIKTLLDAYEKTPMTTPALLEQLENETGLTKKWISSWFMRQRKKTQQASMAKAATTSTEVGASTTTEQPGDASTLEVKKEVCEGVIAGSAPASAPKKKRQRKSGPGSDGASSTSAPPKKRKVNAANGPTAGETFSTTKPSVSIFDKLKVKVERYTPGPEERHGPANNGSTLATILNFGPYAPPPLPDPRLETNASEHGSYHSAPVTGSVQAQPIVQSISAPIPASSPTTEKHGDSAHARRASSPSAIAMKSRRQRVQYAGEGPVMNTRFMHHGFTNASLDSRPGLPSPSMPSPSMAAYQENTGSHNFSLSPATFPYRTGAVASPLPKRTARAQCSDGVRMSPQPKSEATPAASNEEERQDYRFPVLVNEVDTFDFQTNAGSYQIGGKTDSTTGTSAPSALPMHERPTNIRDLYTNPSLGYPQPTDFLDPLHAPLKHLTEILDPICPPTLGRSGYEALLDLEGRQRQVVMEKLLDEDLGVNDPFKAAMGLVLASKMGLQWK
ncbi:hypothetical protein EST38_g487 [Candolleomyces aberdarensis]|uniref:Homeobox domain-containing protein n=1 Tax=Candolleomyces aberdarensis TaxID=2316362 RepID=A0A4Q2DYC9_9AGAR|nr:hypothetical protein EST38_g487 [Candolleomyces aberdarensis]